MNKLLTTCETLYHFAAIDPAEEDGRVCRCEYCGAPGLRFTLDGRVAFVHSIRTVWDDCGNVGDRCIQVPATTV